MNELGYAEMGKSGACTSIVGAVDRNPTVGENIDFRIASLRKEIERLEASKLDLAPLMHMRIRDIRNAMGF